MDQIEDLFQNLGLLLSTGFLNFDSDEEDVTYDDAFLQQGEDLYKEETTATVASTTLPEGKDKKKNSKKINFEKFMF